MSNAPKKKALIVKSFNDAGTGESFTEGDTPMIEAGAFGNYKAAGLVEAAPATAKAPAAKPAAKRKRPAIAKPTPAPSPAPAPLAQPLKGQDPADA